MSGIKKFFNALYDFKWHILLFLFFFILFLVVYFPRDKAVRIILSTLSSQTGVNITPQDPRLRLFPSVSIYANSVRLSTHTDRKSIDLGPTSISIPLTSIVTFSPTMNISSESFMGTIGAKVLGLPINPNRRIEELYVDLNTDRVRIDTLTRGRLPVDITGVLNLVVQGNLNVMNPLFSDLDLTVALSNVNLKKGLFMGFPIPEVLVNRLDINLAIDRGDMIIANFSAGSPDEDISISVRGTMSFKGSRPYNLNIRLKIAGELEQQFGQFLMMLPPQALNEEGFYNINVSGSQRTPMPQITPVR